MPENDGSSSGVVTFNTGTTTEVYDGTTDGIAYTLTTTNPFFENRHADIWKSYNVLSIKDLMGMYKEADDIDFMAGLVGEEK